MKSLTVFDRVVLIALAALAVTFGMLTGVSRSRQGLRFGDGFLEQVEKTAEKTVYQGVIDEEETTVTVTPGGESETVEVTLRAGNRPAQVCTVERGVPYMPQPGSTAFVAMEEQSVEGVRIIKDGEVLFEGGYQPREELNWWYDENGEWLLEVSMDASHLGSQFSWDTYELSAPGAMLFAGETELTARGSWAGFAGGTIIMLAAMANLYFAEKLFHWRTSWYVRNPKPTDYYFTENRILSVILGAMALGIYLIALRSFG